MKAVERDGKKYKICYVCRKEFLLTSENFYRNKSKEDGFELCCKGCSKQRLAAYHKSKSPKTLDEKKEYNSYRNTWRLSQYEKGKCRVCKESRLSDSKYCKKHFLSELAAKHLGTSKRWSELDELFLKQNGRCVYSGRLLILGINASIDHKKPLSKYPELNFDIKNLQWVDSTINRWKGNLEESDFIDLINDVFQNLNSSREFTTADCTRTCE